MANISYIKIGNTTYDIHDPNAAGSIEFDGTYDSSTNKAATVSTVTDAINNLDGGSIGTPGAGKTLSSLSETNGQVSATFQDIEITTSQVSDFPESMPASDVYDWAKASTKPTYTYSEVGAASSSHTHTLSLATSTGTSSLTLAHGGKYQLTAGGSTYIFTMPSDNNTNYYHTTGSWSGLKYTATANGGAGELSFTIPTGTSSTTVALGNHTHSQYLTSSSTLNAENLSGEVPSSCLPSYVDDVLEYDSTDDFPSTGETGKIYVATDTNLTYRWSGSAYVEISASLALGETSSTAYRGDYGAIAYAHSQATHARTDATATAASSTNGNITINGTETTVYTHPSYTAVSAAAVKIGRDATGHVVIGNALSYSDVGAASSSHTHTTSLTSSSGTSTITLAHGSKYQLTAGGTSVIFTMPTDSGDTTYSAGTGLSLSGTTFNHSNSVTAGTAGTSSATSGSTLAVPYVTYDAQGHITASGTHTHTISGFATSGHTHSLSMASSSDTSSITLAANTPYKLTAGGSSYVFTTPPDTNTTYSQADSAKTGITISDHSTSSIYGVSSSTTTASKVTLGTAFSIPNVTAVGSTPTLGTAISADDITAWDAGSTPTLGTAFSVPNVTAVGSVPSLSYTSRSIPNVTAVGSGSFGATVSNGVLSFSHVHTAPTLGTAISADDITSWSAGSVPTLGTAFSIPNVTDVGSTPSLSYTARSIPNVTDVGSTPTLGTAFSVPNVTGNSSVTVPIKNSDATTVVTSATHTVSDSGHTHSLS